MTFQNGVDGVPTDDGLLLVAHGELDAATADECYTEMAETVEQHWRTTPTPASVVVDLCAVRFLSCAGVRVVLRLARWGVRAGVPVGMTVPDDGPVRRIVDVLGVRSSVPVVACPASGVHEAGYPPRECRSSGAVVTGDVTGRAGGGPEAHRRISPEAVHRPYVSGGATRSRRPGQAGDPENASGHRRPSEIRTRPPTNA
ncbi:STAS domain-containing protein [Nocardia beijingensis]|uniref:STAS domain-containing protein n=1 Tax=Nocardia beijingensis TaxID=95162 RepID=UPI001893405E|nr:STAS domain-containing protein [Nocardia beijingensis]MBF6464139.1 STAS domain-containing protein [Nocardia beijingensis]